MVAYLLMVHLCPLVVYHYVEQFWLDLTATSGSDEEKEK